MLYFCGFFVEVFGILVCYNILVDLIIIFEVSVVLIMDIIGLIFVGDILLIQVLLIEFFLLCCVEVEENLVLVVLIGNELLKVCGVGKEVFGVFELFNICMICYGVFSYNLCFLVLGDDVEKVVQKLYYNLFE